MVEKWQDPAYRERASGNNHDDKVYGWRHVASGVEVRRTKQEMREEYGLKHDGLDAVVAGRIASTRGWAADAGGAAVVLPVIQTLRYRRLLCLRTDVRSLLAPLRRQCLMKSSGLSTFKRSAKTNLV